MRSPDRPDPTAVLEALRRVVGPAHVLSDAELRAGYERDWTGRFNGPALAVVRPASTEEVAAVMVVASERHIPVVPQGGNTGLVGGGVPAPADEQLGPAPLIVSTTRLSGIGPVDTTTGQLTAGAGVTLGALQSAARQAAWDFPVDIAYRQSATIGGMAATNAGGLRMLRHGSMRAQIVGLEAVLADGRIISRLTGLTKDNAGYDLSQLVVGSEGTLGMVTALRLRLSPPQPERVVALLGLGNLRQAVAILSEARAHVEGLGAAEVFFSDGVDLVCGHAGLDRPFAEQWPVYLLLECEGSDDPAGALAEALGHYGVNDAATAIAVELPARHRLWAYRERHSEAISTLGVPHKLDLAFPLEALPGAVDRIRETVRRVDPDARAFLFGHIGDGNVHVNVIGPAPDDERVDDAVFRLTAGLGGSISAEHGIGRAKRDWIDLIRSPAELAAMVAVKAALDPSGIMNPGVLLPSADGRRSAR